jgi:hypothetical protein
VIESTTSESRISAEEQAMDLHLRDKHILITGGVGGSSTHGRKLVGE